MPALRISWRHIRMLPRRIGVGAWATGGVPDSDIPTMPAGRFFQMGHTKVWVMYTLCNTLSSIVYCGSDYIQSVNLKALTPD
jgi:hypothetical protein